MKRLIFDFDGVIQNTFEFHRKKIREFTGIQLSVSEYRAVHRKNFFLNIPKNFEKINWSDYSLFVHDELCALKIKKEIKKIILGFAKKHNLYIVSSGSGKTISRYLEENGFSGEFKEILGHEFLKSKAEKFKYLFKKYQFSSEDGLFITDTLGDIEEANEVKLKTVAVDFGFHSRKTLQEGNPFSIVSSFNELSSIIKQYD